MLKYIILAFNAYISVHCMESIILDYSSINDILFPKPQPNTYNVVTIYNPCLLYKNNIIPHLIAIHEYLKPCGQLHALLRTQTNNIFIQEEAFLDIYAQIYLKTLPADQKIKLENIPSVASLKAMYFTDDELKEIIWSNGYNIISYENKIYQNVIQNKSIYKQEIKSAFVNAIRTIQLPKDEIESLSKQLIKLIIQQCQRNNLGEFIESWNFTELKLSKKEIDRPPIFINDSLLSEDYSKL